MRLDHLLSKEEEVGVVLLSSCQGVHAMDSGKAQEMCYHNRLRINRRHHRANGRARGDAKHYRESDGQHMDERSNKMILVAMRLGGTPVLIPNTMVKT